MIIKYLNNMTL